MPRILWTSLYSFSYCLVDWQEEGGCGGTLHFLLEAFYYMKGHRAISLFFSSNQPLASINGTLRIKMCDQLGESMLCFIRWWELSVLLKGLEPRP